MGAVGLGLGDHALDFLVGQTAAVRFDLCLGEGASHLRKGRGGGESTKDGGGGGGGEEGLGEEIHKSKK